jgi:recombination protein RecA
MYNEGISLVGDLLDIGVKYEVVKKTGNALSFEAEKLGPGREAAKQFLKDNPKIAKEIEKKIKEKVKG